MADESRCRTCGDVMLVGPHFCRPTRAELLALARRVVELSEARAPLSAEEVREWALRLAQGSCRLRRNGVGVPRRTRPHIDNLVERICATDRTRGIIAR